MVMKPTYEELQQRVKELEQESSERKTKEANRIRVSGIQIEWHPEKGTCTFENLPVAMMWVDTTLAGLMSGVQNMVGTRRYALAQQSEGRKSVEEDWQVISKFPDFSEGFKAIANIAAVAGWGRWELTSLDQEQRECLFRVEDSWEGRYQRSLGVCWGSGMLAGKMAGYCSKLFGANCWAEQTAFIARGDNCDEFIVRPSLRSIEKEIEGLLASDAATRADMAVALRRLETEMAERKRTEEVLRESEEKFRSLVETTSDWIWEIDAKGSYTYASPHVRYLLGYEPEEVIGRTPFDFMPPDEVNRVAPEFARIRSERRSFFNLENVNLSKDGRRVTLETSGVPMLDPQGKLLGYRGIDRDITNRKLAEAEKQKLEAQLQQARKMEAIGTLAGGIAHDFNNILMGIQGRASLMLVDMDPSNPHFDHLRGIEEYVKSAADLTRQLLGFARGGKYEVKATDLNELADRSASLFGRTRKEIFVHRKFQPGVWTVEVDRRQIEQVLLNLFVNAWQAMPAGGEIYLQTENVVLAEAYVKAHGVKPGKYVKISVADTGVGMDEQTKQRLFDPFFTTKEMGRGTGLGLASAYGIIKHHEGIISVYSVKGHGSTFNIYLPASDKEASAEITASGDLVRGEGAILLVDDEQMILEVGKPMLEKLGYHVLIARSGKEAVELYQENKELIVAVVLDMIMPQMSGGETFDRLRAANPGVKVLLSSGYSVNGQAQEILNRGCRGFIQKPFDLRELSQRLVEILGKP